VSAVYRERLASAAVVCAPLVQGPTPHPCPSPYRRGVPRALRRNRVVLLSHALARDAKPHEAPKLSYKPHTILYTSYRRPGGVRRFQTRECDEMDIEAILFPYATRRRKNVQHSNIRFVHYTSAEAGISILENRCVWLRDYRLMNDFSEIQHGLDCIKNYLYEHELGKRLKLALEQCEPSLPDYVDMIVENLAEHQINSTYMISISEHGNIGPDETDEDLYGRLSMWRAYGGNTNIAFVFKNKVFVEESQAIGAYTSPILYRDIGGFQTEFSELVGAIENNIEILKNIELNLMRAYLLSVFHFAVISTKHPGFSEEREWRVIHSPTIWPSEILKPVYRVVNGIPQRIYEIPLRNIPERNFMGASIKDLIDKIIIGPTLYAKTIAESFIEKLKKEGIDDASKRVVVTDVPLRR
jgi:hypothetical protein